MLIRAYLNDRLIFGAHVVSAEANFPSKGVAESIGKVLAKKRPLSERDVIKINADNTIKYFCVSYNGNSAEAKEIQRESFFNKPSRIIRSFALFAGLLSLSLSACAPKIEVLPEEAREHLVLKEKKEELFKSGVEEGRRLCREEFLSNLSSEIDKLKGVTGYDEMYKEGFLVPPLVIPIFVDGGVADGGKKLSTPKLEWAIVEDARFTKDDVAKMLLKKKGFIYLGIFEKYSEAEKFSKTIELVNESDKVKLLKVKGVDQIAVMVETTHKDARKYADRYKGVIINE